MKSQHNLDIALKTPIYKFGQPRNNGFLGILSANSNFKHIDLENEVTTSKLHWVIDITLKLLIQELGKPSSNGFPKICPQPQTLTPGDLENDVATPEIS